MINIEVIFARSRDFYYNFTTISLQFHYNFTLYASFVSISLQFSLLTYFFNGGRELIRTNRGRGGTCSQISKHGSFAKKYETRAS